MEHQHEKPPSFDNTMEADWNFGQHIGWQKISKVNSYHGWISLFVELLSSRESNYPASHPQQARWIAKLTEVLVAMQLAIPVGPYTDQDRREWEGMWQAARAFMALHESNVDDHTTTNERVENSMKDHLAQVCSFRPLAVRETPLVQIPLLSGAPFARAIRDEMQNLDPTERDAFKDIWSIADRVQIHVPPR